MTDFLPSYDVIIGNLVPLLLTGEILVFTNVGVSPWVVAPVCDALVLAHPDQAVGAVVELGLAELALPVPVAVLAVPHHLAHRVNESSRKFSQYSLKAHTRAFSLLKAPALSHLRIY